MVCNNCGKFLNPGEQFCTQCGTPVQLQQNNGGVKCSTCGAQLAQGQQFCNVCGTPAHIQQNNMGTPCSTCGAQLMQGQHFCNVCGTPANQVNSCPKCGSPLMPGAPQCNICGALLNRDGSIDPIINQEIEDKKKSALTMGIMGLIFSLTFLLSLLGLIFSAVALSKAKAVKRMTGSFGPKAGTGRGLAIPGLIFGIIFTAYGAILILALLASV